MRDGDRPAGVDRREGPRRGVGRRACEVPTGNAWSTGQVAHHVGMSTDFIAAEIRAGELVASRFGREYRIATAEVRRYLLEKGFPLPDSMQA